MTNVYIILHSENAIITLQIEHANIKHIHTRLLNDARPILETHYYHIAHYYHITRQPDYKAAHAMQTQDMAQA